MEYLKLSDLNNPSKITSILTTQGELIEIIPNCQAFQETKGRLELWQQLEDGSLLMIKRWNKKSIIIMHKPRALMILHIGNTLTKKEKEKIKEFIEENTGGKNNS